MQCMAHKSMHTTVTALSNKPLKSFNLDSMMNFTGQIAWEFRYGICEHG